MMFFAMDRLFALQINPTHRFFIILQLILLVLLPTIIITFVLTFIMSLDVAHSAHFGGALVGFMISIQWASNDQCCRYRRICQRIIFVFLILFFLIIFAIFFLNDAPIIDTTKYIIHN